MLHNRSLKRLPKGRIPRPAAAVAFAALLDSWLRLAGVPGLGSLAAAARLRHRGA